MILDIDIGNSRLKWRCEDQRGAMLNNGDWQEVARALPESPSRVRVANVAGDVISEKVKAWVFDCWGLTPEFAVTGHRAAGVTCAYPDPSRLGVDRWLALLAAHSKFSGDLVVVSAGSAVTVDLLRADGEHLGGYIVPGLELQRSALFGGTSRVKVAADWQQPDLKPGRDTDQAVLKGCLLMTVALIEEAQQALGEGSQVVLAGGDAYNLMNHLPGDRVHRESELVLDGLSVLMP